MKARLISAAPYGLAMMVVGYFAALYGGAELWLGIVGGGLLGFGLGLRPNEPYA